MSKIAKLLPFAALLAFVLWPQVTGYAQVYTCGGGALCVGSASGNFPDGWNVTEGTKADSAWGGSGSGSMIAILKAIYAAVTGSIPAGTASIGKISDVTNVEGTVGAGTAPADMIVGGSVYNSSAPTPTTGQSVALQADSNGNLKVNVAAGGTVAQGSTTSGQGGSLILGATATNPPGETTGQSNAVSLDLNGQLRTAPQCNKVINIAQTATTDVHTFTGFGYICSIVLISATAQNIGVDEGTGTTCETSGTALIATSSTSAATPQMALAANGGFSAVASVAWLRMQASADHLCVLQSSTGEVAGTITYADLTN
jgi:hypothetical protein